MPLFLLLCLLLVVFFFYLKRPGRGAGHRACRWREDRFRPRGKSQCWKCAKCHVEAFTYDGHPPKECKRSLGSGGP